MHVWLAVSLATAVLYTATVLLTQGAALVVVVPLIRAMQGFTELLGFPGPGIHGVGYFSWPRFIVQTTIAIVVMSLTVGAVVAAAWRTRDARHCD